MSTMTQSQIHVGCLVLKVTLGKLAKPIQREVERLIATNGIEWACARFKAIWNAANLLRSGDKDAAIEVYKSNSIAYHKSSGLPRGSFKPLVHDYLRASKPSTLKRMAAALRFYTCLQLSGSITERQRRKAESAITSPDLSGTDWRELFTTYVKKGLLTPLMMEDIRTNKEKVWYPSNPPDASHLRPTSYYFSRFKLDRRVRRDFQEEMGGLPERFPYLDMTLSLMTEYWVPKELNTLVPCLEFRETLREEYLDNYLQEHWSDIPDSEGNLDKDRALEKKFCEEELLRPIGRITCIQEPGCKARVVCMPSAFVQLAFLPLHYKLMELAERYFPRESCMLDQQKGVYQVMELMERGGQPVCVDLSSATDRFPREFSCTLLEALGMENWARALREVCESTFDSPWGPTTYAVGQPMGLYGSFPLFHLSHMVFTYGCVRNYINWWTKEKGRDLSKLQTFSDGSYFKVLGDDIVLSDQRIADYYRQNLEKRQIPISESKCFKGNLVEFAGFLVTRGRNGKSIAFRPYKIPSGDVITNGINFLDSLGIAVTKLSKYWERQFAIYSKTTGQRLLDLSPMIPDDTPDYGVSPYHGDTRQIHSIRNRLLFSMPSLPTGMGSGFSPSQCRLPLFHESEVDNVFRPGTGRAMDPHGFSPRQLVSGKRHDLPASALAQVNLSKDPLMKKISSESKTRKSSGLER